MDSRRMGRTQWYEIYPLEDFKVAVNEDILLVDVGGGIGHDLVNFNERRKSLDIPGHLVLQDLPNVIAQVPKDWALQMTKGAHSFFDPQPDQYRHARAYYMRMILHDWANAACLTILGRLRDAVKPGYSTLLLNGIILPSVECPYWAAATDPTPMSSFGGKERTLQEWHELIDQVPELKIEKILPIDEERDLST
ncbi:hypothetical protein M409DRAFT_24935 [Zasmidium cellare ATCC 36951]|uniref:O-methyltransferase C-terminal domain-containing protein n=1 Tax=Zasmidium cellare ATCC 36951 TaxID=1080233 RepID=A0A6A6CBJ9_ZASCE|nr:uncharacterized protein M409DRAFT_24935 [Zasmidium cellare ATCC 36951]KAF2164534.1 hypothetical protein M409DRAFT_24935 [Zasmidium cellare ATCC 36951]